MMNGIARTRLVTAVAVLAFCGVATAQTRVNYGRITAATLVTQQNEEAQAGGAVLGGMVGLASSAGRSGGSAVARGIGGALAGQQIGRVASQRQAFQYTILIDDRSTITMIIDEAGLRAGDCVAVERGPFHNLRLVDESRCASLASAAAKPAPAPNETAEDVRIADACSQAKDRLFDSKTDDQFERAYRTVRLLCND